MPPANQNLFFRLRVVLDLWIHGVGFMHLKSTRRLNETVRRGHYMPYVQITLRVHLWLFLPLLLSNAVK